ncbi:MAG: hypothetical protein AB8F94_23040 [Saprospiraceae bacterium]
MRDDKLKIYDQLIALTPYQRKGKTMPYTSANGYMFTLFNKDNEIGIRLSKESQTAFKEKYNSTIYKSYGAVMKDYVLVPENMWDDLELLAKYVVESYEFVISRKPKETKKKK